jgi:hypothetical protein
MMRTTTLVAGLSALLALSACGAPDYGYYDANGNFIPPANGASPSEQSRRHAPSPGQVSANTTYYNDQVVVVPATVPDTYTYSRRGYYDYYGNFVTVSPNYAVPADMYPPRGMCRVWLPNRAPESQPRIESCNNIQYRVPAGGYVIYGG